MTTGSTAAIWRIWWRHYVKDRRAMSLLDDLLKTLDKMVNDQFDSVEFKTLLDLPLPWSEALLRRAKRALHQPRRDCWGYVQGGARAGRKARDWEHESDELINDPRAGMDHYALTVKQGEVIGLKPEDFEKTEFRRWCARFYAWHHIAMRSTGSRPIPPRTCWNGATMAKSSTARHVYRVGKNSRMSGHKSEKNDFP